VQCPILHYFYLFESNVENGNSRITGGWSGYGGIEKLGYSREIYIQKNAKEDDRLLPHIHTIISLLKRRLLGTHRVRLNENTYNHTLKNMFFDLIAENQHKEDCYPIGF
jgi:hypothetical protein